MISASLRFNCIKLFVLRFISTNHRLPNPNHSPTFTVSPLPQNRLCRPRLTVTKCSAKWSPLTHPHRLCYISELSALAPSIACGGGLGWGFPAHLNITSAGKCCTKPGRSLLRLTRRQLGAPCDRLLIVLEKFVVPFGWAPFVALLPCRSSHNVLFRRRPFDS